MSDEHPDFSVEIDTTMTVGQIDIHYACGILIPQDLTVMSDVSDDARQAIEALMPILGVEFTSIYEQVAPVEMMCGWQTLAALQGQLQALGETRPRPMRAHWAKIARDAQAITATSLRKHGL